MTQEIKLKHKHFYSDNYRVQCAVRQLIKWRNEKGLNWWRKYLSKHKISQELLNDYADQWAKNNRTGNWGVWK